MGLLDFLTGKKPQPSPAPAPQPGGLLGQVPSGQQQMTYRQYAEDCMMKGQQPMSMQDWMKAQQARK